MEKEVISHCPVCSSKLIATELSCKNCNLQVKGDFAFNKYAYLSKDELEFLEAFLTAEGSFKSIQEEMGITYFKAKGILADILDKLGLKEKVEAERMDNFMENRVSRIVVKDDDHFITKLIKDKLNSDGGQAEIPLIQAGKKILIGFDSDGSGLICDKIPVPKQLIWDVFIAAYNILIVNEGEIYKGYARTGKLGSERLPIDSLEGYIAYEVHGVRQGESAFSPGFVVAAILDWVGILKNERGSTLQISDKFTKIESYEESLSNAIKFNQALQESEWLRKKINIFRDWYYFAEMDIFAPGQLIGYKGIDSRTYEAYKVSNNRNPDGRDSYRRLERFFYQANSDTAKAISLKLEAFLSRYTRVPNVGRLLYIKK